MLANHVLALLNLLRVNPSSFLTANESNQWYFGEAEKTLFKPVLNVVLAGNSKNMTRRSYMFFRTVISSMSVVEEDSSKLVAVRLVLRMKSIVLQMLK